MRQPDLALDGGILGRTDDMLVVRGVNVYPSAVENILRGFDAVREYRVEIQNHRTLPELSIQVETAPATAPIRPCRIAWKRPSPMRSRCAFPSHWFPRGVCRDLK